MATKKKKKTQKDAEVLIDELLEEMALHAVDTWIEELRDIETVAGVEAWATVADKLIELVAHIRAGAPLERTTDVG